jgi:hypothetical protein
MLCAMSSPLSCILRPVSEIISLPCVLPNSITIRQYCACRPCVSDALSYFLGVCQLGTACDLLYGTGGDRYGGQWMSDSRTDKQPSQV